MPSWILRERGPDRPQISAATRNLVCWRGPRGGAFDGLYTMIRIDNMRLPETQERCVFRLIVVPVISEHDVKDLDRFEKPILLGEVFVAALVKKDRSADAFADSPILSQFLVPIDTGHK